MNPFISGGGSEISEAVASKAAISSTTAYTATTTTTLTSFVSTPTTATTTATAAMFYSTEEVNFVLISFNLSYAGGGLMCPPPKVFLFFYQKSLPLTKP